MASSKSDLNQSSSPLESGWIKLVRRTGDTDSAAEELSASPSPSSSAPISSSAGAAMETTDRDLADQATTSSSSLLSSRGQKNSKFLSGPIKKVAAVFRDQYDSELNPNGIVVLGVADNALMRGELLKFFNTDRLHLTGPELTYGDRFFTSTRLITALCKLFNDTPVGLDKDKPKLIKKVTADDIVVGSGATGILDALFMMLCNPGEGVLLSVPYYNGFDHDLTARAEAKIVEVYPPLPEVLDPSKPKEPVQPSPAFTVDTVKAYQTALDKARKDGTTVKALMICNPHNPTGLVYPRETIIALAKFAAKEKLHFVVDEIYARSVFHSADIPDSSATQFETILSIDVEKEAGLPRGQVHVVTSASKDFGINGFRLGVYVNQGSEEIISAMTSVGILSQASAPAGALWYSWLEDEDFLSWYFAENHRRMQGAYEYVTKWCREHKIPYVPSNSGHFLMLDFQRFLKVKDSESEEKRREAEGDLTSRLMDKGVFIAPGAQYHHPIPGWFRLTFSLSPIAVREGLSRAEKVLGLKSYISTVSVPNFEEGKIELPERFAQMQLRS